MEVCGDGGWEAWAEVGVVWLGAEGAEWVMKESVLGLKGTAGAEMGAAARRGARPDWPWKV